MIRRFLQLGTVPELRAEPGKTNREEIELLMPIDVYWDAKELVRLIQYSVSGDVASSRYWSNLAELVKPYIVHESQRNWFCKNVASH